MTIEASIEGELGGRSRIHLSGCAVLPPRSTSQPKNVKNNSGPTMNGDVDLLG